MYRYDWYVGTEIINKKIFENENNKNKLEKIFYNLLRYLDASSIKRVCGEWALKVVRDGAFYGYVVPSKDSLVMQELPINYCRVRYKSNNIPAVEFNMKYFQEQFTDVGYRSRILKLFPQEIQHGYHLFASGKLPKDPNDQDGWYLLTIGSAFKFSLYDIIDFPLLAAIIPSLLDLDAAQDLDRRKQMQKLLKVLIQQLPLDKNNDLVFDVDEARDLHRNAVEMLQNAIGVDVLTTFATIKMEDLADSNSSVNSDDLERVERTVFNNAGVAQKIFNADGNLAVSTSILQDESTMRNLLLQFNDFFNYVVKIYTGNKSQYKFTFNMLETTQYNYKEMAKLYREQTQMGYSKLLPQIALGQSQSFILNSMYFENEVLELSTIMIPPITSATMNGEDLKQAQDANKGGRPEKEESEKSDKTIANIESQG